MITPLQMGIFETIELHKLIAQGKGESLLSDMCRDRLDYCFTMLSQEDKEFLTEVSRKLEMIYNNEKI